MKAKKHRETFKTMLPKIVRFLNDNPEGHKLWCVLTALRGPDDGKGKNATTAVIRHAIGIKYSIFATVLPDDEIAATFRKQTNLDFHFACHAKDAFSVLGLNWESVNKPPKRVRK